MRCVLLPVFSILGGLLIGATTASAEVPQIIAGTNGEAEVIFKNNCVVYYNAKNRQTNKLPKCTKAQVVQAGDAILRYRREQGTGGRPVADHNDPTAKVRVCCQRGSRDWFTTRELCRGSSGKEVTGILCRNDANNRPWSPGRLDYERVCCARNNHDWFTTRGECRHSGGLEVLPVLCRNDQDNSAWWYSHRGEDYDNFEARPSFGNFAGRSDLSLTCYGEGDRPVLENWDDRRWYVDRASFPAAVMIELFQQGPGYKGRIHPSGRLIPPIHEGDRGGWWDLKKVVVTPYEIRGEFKLNGFNKPEIFVDRRTGRITIRGLETFLGRCWAGF